jgi:hypothetical protein
MLGVEQVWEAGQLLKAQYLERLSPCQD